MHHLEKEVKKLKVKAEALMTGCHLNPDGFDLKAHYAKYIEGRKVFPGGYELSPEEKLGFTRLPCGWWNGIRRSRIPVLGIKFLEQ